MILKDIFLCQKLAKSLQKKKSLKNTQMGDKLLLIPYFDNSDFQSHFSMSKIGQIFTIFFLIEECKNGGSTFIIKIFS